MSTAKPSWPAYKGRTSVFGSDPQFLSPEAKGQQARRRRDEEVTAFQTKGHGGRDLGLAGSLRVPRKAGGA